MTRAAFAAGLPAPEVFDEVTANGRFGIVMSRHDGPTLLDGLKSGAITTGEAGAIMAGLYRSVHATPPPPEVLSVRTWFDALSRVPGGIPEHIAPGILALIERLPPGEGLCHGDLHSDNVIMTADGPVIIDWVATIRAPAAWDLGRCQVTFSELIYAPDDVDPERPRALNAAIQAQYARLAGLTPEALTTAMAPWLPILRAFALADRISSSARRERVIRSLEATLRVQG